MPDRLDDPLKFTFDPDPIGEQMTTARPVVFRIVTGVRTDGSVGVIGAFWKADNNSASGFKPAMAVYDPSEMILEWRDGLERGFSPRQVYESWSERYDRSTITSVSEEGKAASTLELRDLIDRVAAS